MNEWMDKWMEAPYYGVAIGLLALLSLLLIIWISVVGRRLVKLRRQYTRAMGQTGVMNLEDVIVGLRLAIDDQEARIDQFDSKLTELGQLLKQVKGHIGVFRYNAFSNQGSDMSFSVAIVSEDKTGVVLTGLHGRDETYMYAKPLQKGSSAYLLTPEEERAISLALQRE